jgi:hypothetical protein
MVSNNQTKLGGMNDRETGKLTGIDCPGDQATDPPEVHRRGKDPDRPRGPAGRGRHCRALPEGRHSSHDVFQMEQGVPRGGQKAAQGDTIREAGSDEVKELRLENDALKMLVAELTLRNRALKKPLRVWDPDPSIHEVHAVGEDGDHPDGRGVLAERQTDIARDGRSPQFLL